MNHRIKTGSIFLLAAVLVAGTISMTVPSLFAQPYYPEYEDPYAKDHKDPKNVNVQKIKCVNSNVNVNGVDVNQFLDENGAALTEAQQLEEDGTTNENGNGLVSDGGGLNIDRNLLNICVDLNFNNQERIPLIGDITTPFPQ